MKNFSQLISEARFNDATSMLVNDITKFNNKLKKSLPVDVQKAIYLTAKLGITDSGVLDEIRTATKSKLNGLVDKLNVPLGELEDLWTLMKTIKQNYKVMPQYLSASEREQLEKGMLSLDDATIDLTSKAGRDAAAKRYMPLVISMVNKFVGQSKLSKADLMSAGTLALTNAMNDWKREPDEKTGKVVSFKTYVANRVRQQILNDMDWYGHTLSGTNSYATKKSRDGELGTSLDAVSFDALTDIEHMGELGAVDMNHDDNPLWKKFYTWLNKTFTQRDVDIFIRFMGLNGKKEKSKDIAKAYGMSEGNIQNSIIKKIIKKIQNTPQLMEIFSEIFNIYSESLMVGMIGMTRDQIMETFANDDTFLMLEEMSRFNTAAGFNKYYTYAMGQLSDTEQEIIKQSLAGGFTVIDSTLRKNQNTFKKFLKMMNPTAKMNLTDGDIIDGMSTYAEYVQKYRL